MSEHQKLVKRPDQAVHARRLDLDTDGFTYRKWGGQQRCKAGDWIVSSDGDTYTLDAKTFARNYRHLKDGAYLQPHAGLGRTGDRGRRGADEGRRHQVSGWRLSGLEPGRRRRGYAVAKAKFERTFTAPRVGRSPPPHHLDPARILDHLALHAPAPQERLF